MALVGGRARIVRLNRVTARFFESAVIRLRKHIRGAHGLVNDLSVLPRGSRSSLSSWGTNLKQENVTSYQTGSGKKIRSVVITKYSTQQMLLGRPESYTTVIDEDSNQYGQDELFSTYCLFLKQLVTIEQFMTIYNSSE